MLFNSIMSIFFIMDVYNSYVKSDKSLDAAAEINDESFKNMVVKSVDDFGREHYLYNKKVIGHSLQDVDDYFDNKRRHNLLFKGISYAIRAGVGMVIIKYLAVEEYKEINRSYTKN